MAYPGGRIYVNGALMGTDATATMVLKPGRHYIRIENRFLGTQTMTVELTEAQAGVVPLDW